MENKELNKFSNNENKRNKKERLETLERFMLCGCDGTKISKEQKSKFREANEMLLEALDEARDYGK